MISGAIPPQLLHDLSGVSGFDEQPFLQAHRQPPPTSVRVNPARDTGAFSSCAPVPWCDGGYYLPTRPVFTLDPAFHAGAYYVQEASSMFLQYMLRQFIGQRRALRVLDLCAAPGGKSTLIASLLDPDSLLISNEVIRARATILDENITRWGHMNTWVAANDPRDFGKLKGYFDIIVVDAPCSGSGLFRKDARALQEWSQANVQLCSERQARILADVWPSLKEDGILVYATCSYSPAEDEGILDWLAGNCHAASLPVAVPQGWGIATTQSAGGMTGYRFFPGNVEGEGFFIAAVKKTESTAEQDYPRFKTAHDKKLWPLAAPLLAATDAVLVPATADEFTAMRPSHEADWQLLHKLVYFRRAGLRMGSPAGKDWIPAHDVALSIDAARDLPAVAATREQALRFLRREDMGLNGLDRGWMVVKYEGLGLGWIKSLGNRVNNYLPKHWRIRMDIEAGD